MQVQVDQLFWTNKFVNFLKLQILMLYKIVNLNSRYNIVTKKKLQL